MSLFTNCFKVRELKSVWNKSEQSLLKNGQQINLKTFSIIIFVLKFLNQMIVKKKKRIRNELKNVIKEWALTTTAHGFG